MITLPSPSEVRAPEAQVDPRCTFWWTTQIVIVLGVPGASMAIVGGVLPPTRAWLWAPAAACLVLGLILVMTMPRLRLRIHRWEVTADAVYARRGWLWCEWRAVPLARIQTVDLVRGPLQRMFGLSSVTVTTASSRGAVVIEALDEAMAEDLLHRLTSLTQGRAQDADAT